MLALHWADRGQWWREGHNGGEIGLETLNALHNCQGKGAGRSVAS